MNGQPFLRIKPPFFDKKYSFRRNTIEVFCLEACIC